MTIICAYTDSKHTWLGSDTAAVANMGNSLYPADVGSKWTIFNGWAFGMVGDDLASKMIADHAPVLFDELPPDAPFAAGLFTERLRELFAKYGFRPVYGNDACPNWQSSGILATAGRFWDVDGTTSYTAKPAGELFARGGAMPIALGAAYGYLRAQRDSGTAYSVRPESLIDVALDAAIRFDMQIRGKWTGRL
jgi:hypothetical protein